MEPVHPLNRSRSNDKNTNGSGPFTPRPRAASERDAISIGVVSAQEENRSPSTLPRSFHAMLKTTTETGDIGMFSIKPSRIPQALSSPRSNNILRAENGQKTRHVFQPYGIPIVDDRRRLPSYARDATLEAIAAYESPRQRPDDRSPRESNYRSYSLTQTSSYPPHTLSNHRSFASLRSQLEVNGQLQRPRSPFAYPIRLRRPGFRPSSPALTDSGLVDYSRRAEIERAPHGPGSSTTSPGSLYAQKRKPLRLLSLRSEVNRSTSLLPEQSPPRHSSSPNLRQNTAYQGAEWSRNPLRTPGNTSPARSTYSLASTVNILAMAAPASTTTTPGKIHPPSPLYYDYTEDFDIDDHIDSEPPPVFRINQSIPEDGPPTSDIQAVVTTQSKISGSSPASTLDGSFSPEAVIQKSFEKSLGSSEATRGTDISSSIPFNHTTSLPEEELGFRLVDCERDTNVIKLPGSGHTSRGLSSPCEEIFGPVSRYSSHTPTSDGQDFYDSRTKANEDTSTHQSIHESTGLNQMSPRSSIGSLKTDLRQFPQPPRRQISVTANPAPIAPNELTGERIGDTVSNGSFHKRQCSAEIQNMYDEIGGGESHLPTRWMSQQVKKGATMADSLDVAKMNHFIKSPFSDTDDLKNPQTATVSRLSLEIPSPQQIYTAQTDERSRSRTRCIENQNAHFTAHNRAQAQIYRRDRQEESLEEHRKFDLDNLPNFSHQLSSRLVTRPESPMLAPKPISPARQLKLKNSIPQIMKALPPLPLDSPASSALSAARKLSTWEPALSQRIPPPLEKAPNHTSSQKENEKGILASSQDGYIPIVGREGAFAEEGEPQSANSAPPLAPLPRLKLKSKYSSNSPLSPQSARPWNKEESYPWSNETLMVNLPPLSPREHCSISPPPKFKLKVTRASNSSEDTILINRENSDLRGLGGLTWRMPKDLFTPTSGFDNILRQVSKHFRPRTSQSLHKSETDSASLGTPCPTESVHDMVKDEDRIRSETRTKSDHSSTHGGGARSTFSYNSSPVNGRRKLRARLSNLRARIYFRYANKSAARSSDDIIWRRRNEVTHVSSVLRSASNLNSPGPVNGRPRRRRMGGRSRGRKIKVKVQGWLSQARSAISGHMRSQSPMDRKSDDDTARIPPI